MGSDPVWRDSHGWLVTQGCCVMSLQPGDVAPGVGAALDSGGGGVTRVGDGAVDQPRLIYANKINRLSIIFVTPMVSDVVHDPTICVTHFKLREAELVMAQKTAEDAVSPDEYVCAEPVIRILSPAQRLAPAASAVAGTVR